MSTAGGAFGGASIQSVLDASFLFPISSFPLRRMWSSGFTGASVLLVRVSWACSRSFSCLSLCISACFCKSSWSRLYWARRSVISSSTFSASLRRASSLRIAWSSATVLLEYSACTGPEAFDDVDVVFVGSIVALLSLESFSLLLESVLDVDRLDSFSRLLEFNFLVLAFSSSLREW